MAALRKAAKKIVQYSGGFGAWHRLRNRECLTVLMFHRVLPLADQTRQGADPEYTVTPELLAAVLRFAGRHYTFIGVDELLAARAHGAPLPAYPLLVTFDDGWRDNLVHARPVLAAQNVPWLLFAAADAIAAPEVWWHEPLEWAVRNGKADLAELWGRAKPETGGAGQDAPGNLLDLLVRFGALSPEHRWAILGPYADELLASAGGRLMLDAAELNDLAKSGTGIGVHGATHLPLTRLADPADDMVRARRWLTANSGTAAGETISFPHGRYDAGTVSAARDAGFRLMFTSDPVLNRCPGGVPASDVLGRVPIAAAAVTDDSGRLAPERLAPWLILRERQ
jgi:peptidoglycan/xylan/chitin deacetylase (PgdA/CDA1 family)